MAGCLKYLLGRHYPVLFSKRSVLHVQLELFCIFITSRELLRLIFLEFQVVAICIQ